MNQLKCALCMRQRFLDIEEDRPTDHMVTVRYAETLFQGTATCYVHLEDLYAMTPIAQVRPIGDRR